MNSLQAYFISSMICLLASFGHAEAIRFIVETENKKQTESAVFALNGINSLLSDKQLPNTSKDAVNFVFLLRDSAITNGKIAPETIEVLKGDVFDELSQTNAPNDDCFIQRFTLLDTGDVVVGISSSTESLDDWMTCFSAAIKFLLTEQTDFDLSVDWRDRVLHAVSDFRAK